MTARQTLLDGLARDADIFELVSKLAPLHPRNNTFPGEVFLHLAGDAPPRAGRACRCVRHARTWPGALATRRNKRGRRFRGNAAVRCEAGDEIGQESRSVAR